MKKADKMKCRSCCPISSALDILGDRWSLLVVRDIMLMGKHEFQEFQSGPEGIATNILADRLKRLVALNVLRFKSHPSHKLKKIYYLTECGKDLLPVMVELILWGGTHHPPSGMPRKRFEAIRSDPKKMMTEVLNEIAIWEKENLASK